MVDPLSRLDVYSTLVKMLYQTTGNTYQNSARIPGAIFVYVLLLGPEVVDLEQGQYDFHWSMSARSQIQLEDAQGGRQYSACRPVVDSQHLERENL